MRTDRFSPREDVEWAAGAFDDGYEARMVYGASIDSGPRIEQVGAYCARSWRAGWCDADMTIMADILANEASKGISDPLTEGASRFDEVPIPNPAQTVKKRIEKLEEALRGLLELGRKDTSNPKYDGYYEAARAVLGK